MSETVEKAIREQFPDAIAESKDVFGTLNIKIDRKYLLDICKVLCDTPELRFDYLADITSIDFKDRIEIIYQFYSMKHKRRVALRADLYRTTPEIDSLCSIWKGANYQEREVYDLMGVIFNGHPELERILLPLDWEGYPLRKDYVIPD